MKRYPIYLSRHEKEEDLDIEFHLKTRRIPPDFPDSMIDHDTDTESYEAGKTLANKLLDIGDSYFLRGMAHELGFCERRKG